METTQTTTLQLPAFLHGTYEEVHRRANAEGRRCAKQYQLDGSFPAPRELRTVAPEEWVHTESVSDFQDDRPAWRLYEFWETLMGLGEVLRKPYRHLRDSHEPFLLGTAWGALFLALSGPAPYSAEHTARRLQAVLRFWDSLQHGRYVHKKLGVFLSLEELLTEACGWAPDAWCPEGGNSVRARFQVAAERMARATREDSVQAILRQLPRILPFANQKLLHHPDVVTNLSAWPEHLATLNDSDFERVSGVRPSEVLQSLYLWDKRLDAH